MPIVDRLEFPRKYKLKSTVLLIAIACAIFGLWLRNHHQQSLNRDIVISEISFADYGTQYIELSYRLQNLSRKEQHINLLARVWDKEGNELASALFPIDIQPSSQSMRSKMLDRLNRTLKEGERPYRAEISLYQK